MTVWTKRGFQRLERRKLVALAIATSCLGACATAGSEPELVTIRPPVVEYEAAFLRRAADELNLPPPSAVIATLLGDYAVMREQARACRSE